MSNELTPTEQFLLVQAMYSVLADKVSTKVSGNMRSAVNDAYREVYERTGAKTFTLKFCGEKVGTYSISESKGTPDREERRFEVTNDGALDSWVRGEDSRMLWDAYMTSHRAEFARWYFEQTGEMPDGCEMACHVTRGKPAGTYSGNSLKGFDAPKVLELATASGYLPSSVAGLLGGGEDDR